ncbi:delta-aminolevulinic acid dehydratase, partial [Bacillus sp. JJ722]|uniref:delta-aminolevulinic acid dehydratase n=1 Tax=Bacillus sp. JJ722 TaxID=3122973 RepID=UPI002FFDE7B6
WIGRPKDFIDVLSGEDRDNKIDYLFLSFHGDEGRFCMPELDESVYEADEPRGEFLDIQAIRKNADLKGIHVITTGCTLGEEQLAKVFLESGCKTYIGPNDYIDGNAALMFVVRYMYELIQND